MDTARSGQSDSSEQLLEAMPDAIVMVGMDGRVARVNRRAEELSGYTRNELVGMVVEELIPAALRAAHVAHRTAFQRTPAVRSMGAHLDIRFRRKDGSEFPADIALSPVATEGGMLVVAAVRDITERRQAEQDLVQAQERLAILDDRERIGRELHDGAIQALFAVGMSLQGMAISTADAGLRERLEGTVGRIDEVIRDLRNYIFGLRPGLAADRHLGLALQELADQLEEQHGVACAVDVDPAVAAVLAGRAGDIVQVAREALSNVGRHAEAATCRLSLRAEDGLAVMEVEDDGRGFVAGANGGGGGWGLRNLSERAAAMGGSLDVASVPGEGTKVSLRVPL